MLSKKKERNRNCNSSSLSKHLEKWDRNELTILMENGFCEVNSKIGGHHQIPEITFEVSVDTLARHQMLECEGLGSSDFLAIIHM